MKREPAGGRAPRGSRGLGLVILVLASIWLAGGAGADGGGAGEPRDRLLLMPRVAVGLEYGGYILNHGVGASVIHRDLEFYLLRYGPHEIYLEFREETQIGVPTDPWEFNRMFFRLATPGYRYDLGEHYLGLRLGHRCINNFQTDQYHGNSTNRTFVGTYELSLEFLDKGMLLGWKDRGISFDPSRPFEWLWDWHYRFTAGRILTKDPYSIRPNWTVSGRVRLDLCRYRLLVPYVEGGVEAWLGPSSYVYPSGEAGVRFHLRRDLDLMPFIAGGQQPEFYSHPATLSFFQQRVKGFMYGGLRMEASLDGLGEDRRSGEGWQWFPEIHGRGGYEKLLTSRFYGWGGGLTINLEVLRRAPWTVFFYSGLHEDTRKVDLAPNKVTYWMQYGLTYSREPFFVEAFAEDGRRLDCKHPRSESTHLAGLRLGTQGMKPGYYNYGISFAEPGFHWLNKFNAQVSAGHYYDNKDWQYLWRVAGEARWDICRFYFVVPYASGGVAWLNGGGATPDAVNGTAEGGLRFHGAFFDLDAYYRFQRQANARYFRSPADAQNIIGLRGLF